MISIEHFSLVKDRINQKASVFLKDNRCKFIKKRLFQLITSKPDELLHLNKQFLRYCKVISIDENRILENISKVIDYDWFVRGRTKSLAFSLSEKLAFNTCPYCNRNYTVSSKLSGRFKGIRPDFDHFFPKSQFPLLALSFYNLIPSCLVCNRSVKTTAPINNLGFIHPYLEGFDTASKFNYLPKDSDSAIGLAHNLKINFKFSEHQSEKVAKCKNSNQLFKIDEIYEACHTSEVADLIRKHYVSNGKYLSMLSESFPGIGSVEELYRLAFGNHYEDDCLEKRPLSKLTKDIVEQLGFY